MSPELHSEIERDAWLIRERQWKIEYRFAPGSRVSKGVIDALKKANIALREMNAFAATAGPGLASSLMIGASIAKGLALGFGKPYLAMNHLEGHLLSPFFTEDFEIEPNVSLIVSGGHTLLIEVRGVGQ